MILLNLLRGRVLLALVFLLSSAFSAADSADVVDQEITFLIASVEKSGCVFVRNGDEHSSEDAADHLRLKYRRGKRYAGSAEQFIERLASESSWTGKPYYIQCEDTGDHLSKDWLTAQLLSFRASQTP
ncbi:DUF5329 domain-containing protein [Congregibacter brevis]|uniref:DUF5329 domain-containing protein n=1 Tax=Congregibacter brevis TaxID=3081201 RepID=A0ABZ0IG32_9GAMM|nr:DUF5329 domain-containing protein [Congregibacter sp. IMCC45268]